MFLCWFGCRVDHQPKHSLILNAGILDVYLLETSFSMIHMPSSVRLNTYIQRTFKIAVFICSYGNMVLISTYIVWTNSQQSPSCQPSPHYQLFIIPFILIIRISFNQVILIKTKRILIISFNRPNNIISVIWLLNLKVTTDINIADDKKV